MKHNNQEYLDSAWWTQHKAKTVTDLGLKEALVEFETATNDFQKEADFTVAKHDGVRSALEKVRNKANVTLASCGKIKEKVANATVEHLRGYNQVIDKQKKVYQEWADNYQAKIDDGDKRFLAL